MMATILPPPFDSEPPPPSEPDPITGRVGGPAALDALNKLLCEYDVHSTTLLSRALYLMIEREGLSRDEAGRRLAVMAGWASSDDFADLCRAAGLAGEPSRGRKRQEP